MLKRTVYIQTAFLGDLLLAIPALRQLRVSGAERITLVCRVGLGELMKKLGVIDDYIEVEKGSRRSYLNALQDLSNLPVDQVVCPHESFRSLLFAWRIKAHQKIGFESALGRWIFDRRVKRDLSKPEALRQLSLATLGKISEEWTAASNAADSWSSRVSFPPVGTELLIPNLARLQERRRWVRSNQPKGALRIAVAPGSQWPTKRWGSQGFADAVEVISRSQSVEIEVHGAPGERGLCEEVIGHLHSKGIGAKLCAGKHDLYEVAQAYADSDLLLCNDSGAQHLGALSGVATVALFGPTHIRQGFQAWNGNAVVIAHPRLECRPCGAHGAIECPLGHHRCMSEIQGDRVANVAQALLASLA